MSSPLGLHLAEAKARQLEDPLPSTHGQYLKTVLELEESAVVPLRSRLAERLCISLASVSQMVDSLSRKGWLTLDNDRTLRLSDAGRSQAVKCLRKHRLAECFLHENVGVEWNMLHTEATSWEQAVSDDVLERIDTILDHPARTPYGNTIPRAFDSQWSPGSSPATDMSVTEAMLKDGSPTDVTVRWIGERFQSDPAALATLQQAGVLPDARARLSWNENGIDLLMHETGAALTIDSCLADQLFVVRND